jgi:hypothetical protein
LPIEPPAAISPDTLRTGCVVSKDQTTRPLAAS